MRGEVFALDSGVVEIVVVSGGAEKFLPRRPRPCPLPRDGGSSLLDGGRERRLYLGPEMLAGSHSVHSAATYEPRAGHRKRE